MTDLSSSLVYHDRLRWKNNVGVCSFKHLNSRILHNSFNNNLFLKLYVKLSTSIIFSDEDFEVICSIFYYKIFIM